jgi:hypothetical protein
MNRNQRIILSLLSRLPFREELLRMAQLLKLLASHFTRSNILPKSNTSLKMATEPNNYTRSNKLRETATLHLSIALKKVKVIVLADAQWTIIQTWSLNISRKEISRTEKPF